MGAVIQWRTRNLEKIDEIDFDGPKLYMFCMHINDNYFLLYIGMTQQELKLRVFDRCKLGDTIAGLLGYDFLVSCGSITETDGDDMLHCVDIIENLLISEMKPDINVVTGPVEYKEVSSAGDISYLHDWRMFWRECEPRTDDKFYKNRIMNGEMRAREFVCEGEYFK